jgi:uncharacterized protein YmfQ (DUF2313 family)
MSDRAPWRPRTADAYARRLSTLLPEGEVWPRDPQSTLQRALHGLAQLIARWATDTGTFLLHEAFPPTSSAALLLPDWERVLGLPDPCLRRPSDDLAERRALVLSKLAQRPGRQDRAYYIEIAAALGYDIHITEYRPFECGRSPVAGGIEETGLSTIRGYGLGDPRIRYVWRISGIDVDLTWFAVGGASSTGNDPLLRIEGGDDIACLLRQIAPAHTRLVFDTTAAPATPGVGGIQPAQLPPLLTTAAMDQVFTLTGVPVAAFRAQNLPPGLTLDSATGRVTGLTTLAVGAPYDFTITGAGRGRSALRRYRGVVRDILLAISAPALTRLLIGQTYALNIEFNRPGTFAVTSSIDLAPLGLTLAESPTGWRISGTVLGPVRTETVVLTATDVETGEVATRSYSIAIALPLAVTPASGALAPAYFDTSYQSQVFTISGSTGAYNVTLAAPTALSVEMLTATTFRLVAPAVTANATVALTIATATDTITQSHALSVGPLPISLAAADGGDWVVDEPIDPVVITAAGGISPFTFVATSGLPPGLALATTGPRTATITGTLGESALDTTVAIDISATDTTGTAGLLTISKEVQEDDDMPEPMIVNGAMHVWQEQETFSFNVTAPAAKYTADQWRCHGAGTASRVNDVPPAMGLMHALRYRTNDVTSGLSQIIEDGAAWAQGRTITLSAWVKGPAGKTAKLGIDHVGDSASYTYTGAWQYVTYTATVANDFATLTANAAKPHLVVRINKATTALSTEDVFVTAVKLEIGATATAFKARSHAAELRACQRYYQTSYPRGVYPGAASVSSLFSNGVPLMLPVSMRAAPAAQAYNHQQLNSGWIYEYPNYNTFYPTLYATPTTITVGMSGFLRAWCHYVLDARL